MNIKCVFDTKRFSVKPQGYEVGSIINRMTMNRVHNYTLDEIKSNILKGLTVRPSHCGGREDSWLSQQMFMIDIDNKPAKPKGMSDSDYESLCQEYLKNKYRTYDDIIEHCKNIKLVPTFIYTSFNHRPDHHKMRLVFVLDKEIVDIDIAKKIQLYLMNAIGEVDDQCKNLNRIYFAGKEIVYNSGSILDSETLIKISNDMISLENKGVREKGTNILNELIYLSNILVPLNPTSTQNNNSYNLEAIRNRNVEYLKSKINNPLIEFDSDAEFWHYVYHNINMAELLELKYPKSINCLFHEDKSPSASIYQNPEGVWLYKCHSGECGLVMNIKQLIEKLGNFKSEYKAIKFIKDIYNLSIKETPWSIEQKANIDRIIQSLNLNEFDGLCPQTNKNIRYVKNLFLTMVCIAKENIYGENYCNSDGDVVFFVSLIELAKKMNVYANNLNKISQRLAVLIYHDLVRKLDDDKIPEAMLKKAQALAIDKNQSKRVNFYAIPSWVFEQLKSIETQGEKWKSNGYTIKGTSYEMFYRAEGLEVAQKIYPQHKKITKNGKIINRTTTKNSDKKTNDIVEAIYFLIGEHGYSTEKLIVETLKKKYSYNTTEIQIKKSLKSILDNYGLKRIRCNKKIKEQYGVTISGYPFLIVKI